jgi:hypothetical protein
VTAALGALAAAALAIAVAVRRRTRGPAPATAEIAGDEQVTVVDPSGAVRSVQVARLTMAVGELDRIWTPMHLERLARTYWRFLRRATLGLVRVLYGDGERALVLVFRRVVLLRFREPEYELDASHGTVRWGIEDGLLVSRHGRGAGHLEIDVRREESDRPGCVVARVQVAVVNFYPAIASGISRGFYGATQSVIHVLFTHMFLRSLRRLDLAASRVGRFRDAAPS